VARVRIVLSRKGFDSVSGGCPSPVLPDGSLVSLPIPDERSPVRYGELTWRGWNLGTLVAALTGGRHHSGSGAHLDPDVRPGLRPCRRGWRPAFGQLGAAQGHLRNQGVGVGDLFLFFGLFRPVDGALRWAGPPLHALWGWLQVGAVLSVDDDVRARPREHAGLAAHPHLALPRDRSNTLYVAAEALSIPGVSTRGLPGAGVAARFDPELRLTDGGAARPGRWSLPRWFLTAGARPLSYHAAPARWTPAGERVQLEAVSRGQEFVLQDEYRQAGTWAASLVRRAVSSSGRA